MEMEKIEIVEPEKKKRGRPKSTEIKPPIVKPEKKIKIKPIVEKPPPKKRGRKSKAELEAMKLASKNSITEENFSQHSQNSSQDRNIDPEDNNTDSAIINANALEISQLPSIESNLKVENEKSQNIGIQKETNIEQVDFENTNQIQKTNEKIGLFEGIPSVESPIKEIMPKQIQKDGIKIDLDLSKSILDKNEIEKQENFIDSGITQVYLFDARENNEIQTLNDENLKISTYASKEIPNFPKIDYAKIFSMKQVDRCCSEIFNPKNFENRCLKRPREHNLQDERYEIDIKKVKID